MNNAGAVVTLSSPGELVAKVDFTIERALLVQQHLEGYRQAAPKAHTEMNAEYVIFNLFMELPRDSELDQKLARQILETQPVDGSWALFPSGEGDLCVANYRFSAEISNSPHTGSKELKQICFARALLDFGRIDPSLESSYLSLV